mmetsp:Transcript_64825/g.159564  ORF Transcript_64825/g.159564 Transcript_64825/m.159564 type:complete len:211 (-) Transcript_64825:4428-5060(-)
MEKIVRKRTRRAAMLLSDGMETMSVSIICLRPLSCRTSLKTLTILNTRRMLSPEKLNARVPKGAAQNQSPLIASRTNVEPDSTKTAKSNRFHGSKKYHLGPRPRSLMTASLTKTTMKTTLHQKSAVTVQSSWSCVFIMSVMTLHTITKVMTISNNRFCKSRKQRFRITLLGPLVLLRGSSCEIILLVSFHSCCSGVVKGVIPLLRFLTRL